MKQYELDYIKAKLLDTYKIDITNIESTEDGYINMVFTFEKDTNKTETSIKEPYGDSVESNIGTLDNAIKNACNALFLLD